jgi:arylsulfatase A-like enzyme
LDFPPYVYFRDGTATTTETVTQASQQFPPFMRDGPRAADFDMQGCLDRLTDQAVDVISKMKTLDQPTFLYFPLTAPHKPVLPSKEFAGTTKLGPYGDFLRQVDATVGRVIEALKTSGVIDDTIVIVTSDNGSFMYRYDDDRPDHVDDGGVQGYRASHHTANANWRGTKADVWEAGHRVPFFVRLPGAAHAGTRVDQVVGLVDVMATLCERLGVQRPADAGPDSVSFAALLGDPDAAFDRPPLICHSAAGMFAIRDGRWKLVAGNGSGGREKPSGKPFAEPWMLFNLEADPGETTNVADANPKVLATMTAQLEEIKGDD